MFRANFLKNRFTWVLIPIVKLFFSFSKCHKSKIWSNFAFHEVRLNRRLLCPSRWNNYFKIQWFLTKSRSKCSPKIREKIYQWKITLVVELAIIWWVWPTFSSHCLLSSMQGYRKNLCNVYFSSIFWDAGCGTWGSCIRKQICHSLSYAVLPQEKKATMHLRQKGLKFEATVTLASSSNEISMLEYFENARFMLLTSTISRACLAPDTENHWSGPSREKLTSPCYEHLLQHGINH